MVKGLWPEKKKNQCLSANKGSYAVNVLLGSQLLPFSTVLAWCPGVIYSAVTWWSLHHGRELNKNAIKEDKINLLTVLFNKNSWRMGRQAHKQCTSGWPGKEAGCSGFRPRAGAQQITQPAKPASHPIGAAGRSCYLQIGPGLPHWKRTNQLRPCWWKNSPKPEKDKRPFIWDSSP